MRRRTRRAEIVLQAVRDYVVDPKPLHLDNLSRQEAIDAALHGARLPPAMERLVHTLLGEAGEALVANAEAFAALCAHPPAREELEQLLALLRSRLHTLNDALPDTILRVHATYTRAEVLAALRVTVGEGVSERLRESREGVLWVEHAGVDVLFVTLDKSASSFTETTRYADDPLCADRFHRQSQSRTRPTDPTGRRYQQHLTRGTQVWLLVRERPKDDRGVALPYTFLGPSRYVAHAGERPMSITWQLEVPMPAAMYTRAKVAAG